MKLSFSAAYGTVAEGAFACHLLCVPGEVSERLSRIKSTSKKQETMRHALPATEQPKNVFRLTRQ